VAVCFGRVVAVLAHHPADAARAKTGP
jgi:hypothetical protein